MYPHTVVVAKLPYSFTRPVAKDTGLVYVSYRFKEAMMESTTRLSSTFTRVSTILLSRLLFVAAGSLR